MSLEEVGLDEVKSAAVPKYTAEAGRVDRIAFLTPKIITGQRYWLGPKGNQSCVRAPDPLPEWLTEAEGAPEEKFGFVIFRYTTVEDGELANPEKIQGKVMFWLVSRKKVNEISQAKGGFPVMNMGSDEKQHDMIVSCEDTKYQRTQISVASDCHFKKNAKWYEAVTAEVELAKTKIDQSMGKEFTEPEIRELIGLPSGGAPATAAEDDMDMSGVLDD